jgi:hypothetical protein
MASYAIPPQAGARALATVFLTVNRNQRWKHGGARPLDRVGLGVGAGAKSLKN